MTKSRELLVPVKKIRRKLTEIPGFPDYAANKDGTVWRITPSQVNQYSSGKTVPYPLHQTTRPGGGPCVSLRRPKETVPMLVSHIIAITFMGPREDRAVLHKNHKQNDNRLSNLFYK